LTILPGQDKTGRPEGFSEITLRLGEIWTLVGPTGSGKSRLLADIEWIAKGDTPTGRTILINGQPHRGGIRQRTRQKLVAQLSQNMNFVMDTTVEEFLGLHLRSLKLSDPPSDLVTRVIDEANTLSGEPFSGRTPLTSLSGGQSRALMIADTALLSPRPIVLIDEIENAGIHRRHALSLLVTQKKIVLMATHDPVLALMGKKRIVIKNGGIDQVVTPHADEQHLLRELEAMDQVWQTIRQQLRQGQYLVHPRIKEKN
jgi:ABC-type lipoprotein export system ATPase subunit